MKTPAATEVTTSAQDKRNFTHRLLDTVNAHAYRLIFLGTDNPRHLRVLTVMLKRPISRENLDSIAGCSNGPELVAELRRRGLGGELLCERIQFVDRDGRPCRPGVYYLTPKGRRMVLNWLKTLTKQAQAAIKNEVKKVMR